MKHTWEKRMVSLGMTAALCLGLLVMPAGAAVSDSTTKLTELALKSEDGAVTLYQKTDGAAGFAAGEAEYNVYLPTGAKDITISAAAETAVTAKKGEDSALEAVPDTTYDFAWAAPAADDVITLTVAGNGGDLAEGSYTITAVGQTAVTLDGLTVKAGERELDIAFATGSKDYTVSGLKLEELAAGLTLTPAVSGTDTPVRWSLNGGTETEALSAFTVSPLKNGDKITVTPGDGKATSGDAYTITVGGEEDLKLANLKNPAADGPQLLQTDRDTSKPLTSQRFAKDKYDYTLSVLDGQTVTLEATYTGAETVMWSEVKADEGDEAKVVIGTPDTGTKYKSSVTLALAAGADSAKIAVQAGSNGKPYYITLARTSKIPNVDVKLGASLETVGQVAVSAKNMDVTTLRFSVQMDADSAIVKGFADAAGGTLFASYPETCVSVNVLSNVGYDAGNKQVTGGFDASWKPVAGAAGDDGWTVYTIGGKEAFSYHSAKASGAPVLTYYPATHTLTVSLSVQGTDAGVTELACGDAGVELFRFHYGLAGGKDSGDLYDAITAARKDEKLTMPVQISASEEGTVRNSITDIRLGTVTDQTLPGLVTLTAEPLCTATVFLGVMDAAVAAGKFSYDFEALPGTVTAVEKLEDVKLTQDSITVCLTKGDYRLLVKGDGYLKRSIKLTLTEDVAENTRLTMNDLVQMYAGKVESSAPRAINLLDRAELYTVLDTPLITTKTEDGPAVNTKYNFNEDTKLDVLDLGVLLENLGATSKDYTDSAFDYAMTIPGGAAG